MAAKNVVLAVRLTRSDAAAFRRIAKDDRIKRSQLLHRLIHDELARRTVAEGQEEGQT